MEEFRTNTCRVITLETLKAEVSKAAMLEAIGQIDAAIAVLKSAHLTYAHWWKSNADALARQTAVKENFELGLLSHLIRLKENKSNFQR